MHLIQLGYFTLNSGAESRWKIDCDYFSDDDWDGFALMVCHLVGRFGTVAGVPHGGLNLAAALSRYCDNLGGHQPHLIVDDVLTTGGSMERLRAQTHSGALQTPGGVQVLGAVVFARGPCPSWIRALFQMPECFWLQPRQR